MGKYVASILSDGEVVLYEGQMSLAAQVPLFLIGALFIPAFGAGLLIWGVAIATYYTTELAVTNKRVVAKFGLLTRTTIEINLRRVESVQVHQGILGRIFDFGTVWVSGAGTPQASIPNVQDPMAFRRAVFAAQEAAERRS